MARKPWNKISARMVASVSAVAMLATLAISGTAFALGDNSSDGTTDANGGATATQQTADQKQTDTTGDGTTDNGAADTAKDDATTGSTDGTADDTIGTSDDASDAKQTTDVKQSDQSADDKTAGTQSQSDAKASDTTDADAAKADAAVSPAALNDHTVQGVSPNGTTINAFDYWVCNQDPTRDNTDCTGIGDSGINADHALKFRTNDGTFSDSINKWTTNSTPRQGLVSRTLIDGYPQLSATYGSQSLSYLFDGTDVTGKSSYMDTSGLLQVDSKGYYYYNALSTAYQRGTFDSANFATLNTSSKAWTLYDTWAVNAGGNDSTMNGQFFPFNQASTVLSEDRNGLTQRNIASSNGSLNHYFGLSMSSRFVQPKGGVIQEGLGQGQKMSYHFSGDDDVWVFIDGVLVGDLGGIHNASTLDIDFSTGTVSVSGEYDTTLRELYNSARRLNVTSWNGNTFADNTYHTLNFFYLERGNTDSNMSLKFNLKTIPESEIHKVDQNNGPVAGAEFSLYATDNQYSATGRTLIGTGTTESNGTLVLKDAEGKIVSFDDLYTGANHYTHYALVETKVPDGYRRAPDATEMHLHYMAVDSEQGTGTESGVVLSETNPNESGSLWRTGSLALAKVTTTATTNITDLKGNVIDPSPNKGGVMFAVVMKRDKSVSDIDSSDAWKGVSGDQLKGWRYSKANGLAGVIESYKANKANGDANEFEPTTSGGYEVKIENLPGDIEKYYYLLDSNEKGQTEYTVAYYYSSDKNNVTVNNTVRMNFANFTRQFSANFYIPNIKNELFVQKVDDAGKTIAADATFTLYRISDSVSGADVNCATATLGNAYDTVTVNGTANANGLKVKGSGIFPTGTNKLTKGTYCLAETSQPTGYKLNATRSKIVVNDYGVFADAGSADDGMRVYRGAGWLVRPMSSFATNDDVDNTLTWIKSTPRGVTGFDATTGSPTVNATVPAEGYRARVDGDGQMVTARSRTTTDLQLKYDVDGDPVLAYGYSARQAGDDTLYAFDEGWGLVSSTQDVVPSERDNDPDYNSEADHTNLGNLRLSNLVTGSVIVQFTDETVDAKARISLDKQVKGADWTGANDKNFTFSLVRTDTVNADVTAGDTKLTQCTATDWKDCTTLSAHTVGEIKDGNTQRVGVNDDKSVTDGAFPELTFTQAGTYTFSIKETNDGVAGWHYDSTVYKATVAVTSDGNGGLNAEVTYGRVNDSGSGGNIGGTGTDGLPTFVNAYVAVSSLPLTGGDASARDWLIGGGVFAALAGLALALTYEYRRRKGLTV
ncbi:Spy0128 family protein [Bifidobacterium aerophilum]|uniref:PA14 domain-containing protein n=1 Tax=Bifidobacterium aerophilum TaxID=1798155 RepID=A0A6N9Z893_9BIFI|nr:FctA domain-containing protein [Bifidobacterium aerophilum]NEG90574.1 hypothetical protein [Bifidobacterium aerophilum]